MPSNRAKGGEEALGLFGCFEPPHLLFTQSCGLMRVLRSIVEVLMLAMLHTRQDLAFRRSITFQLIGDDHTRNILQPFKKFPEKSFSALLFPPPLPQAIHTI